MKWLLLLFLVPSVQALENPETLIIENSIILEGEELDCLGKKIFGNGSNWIFANNSIIKNCYLEGFAIGINAENSYLERVMVRDSNIAFKLKNSEGYKLSAINNNFGIILNNSILKKSFANNNYVGFILERSIVKNSLSINNHYGIRLLNKGKVLFSSSNNNRVGFDLTQCNKCKLINVKYENNNINSITR